MTPRAPWLGGVISSRRDGVGDESGDHGDDDGDDVDEEEHAEKRRRIIEMGEDETIIGEDEG